MAAEPATTVTPLPALPAPRWARGLLAAVFFGCLAVGFFQTFFGPGGRRNVSHLEKRTLAPKPGWPGDADALATFPKRSETWVNDHLYLRERLMGINSFLQVKLLKQSPVNDVIIGRDGWLYYNIGLTIDDYRGLVRFTPAQLAFARTYLTVRRDWFRKRGIAYVFVVAPDKHTAYPEFLPARIRRKINQGTMLDQFVAEMARSEPGVDPVPILDLRAPLYAAKQKAEVFYRTDTHWNEAGGQAGALAIREWVQARFPDHPLTAPTGGPSETEEGPGGDLALELGLTKTLRDKYPHWPMSADVVQPSYAEPGLEPWHEYAALFVRENSTSPLHALFLHDSYAHMMTGNLAEAFQATLFLGRPTEMHYASHELMTRLVGTFQPNVVVEEVVERNLSHYFFGDATMPDEMTRFAADL